LLLLNFDGFRSLVLIARIYKCLLWSYTIQTLAWTEARHS
jgi:hypothetical protein